MFTLTAKVRRLSLGVLFVLALGDHLGAAPAFGHSANQIQLRRRTLAGPSAARNATSSARRLQLVQFANPPTDDDIGLLTDSGVRVVHYLADNGFLVWVPNDASRRRLAVASARSSQLRSSQDFEPTDAIDPRLDAQRASAAPVDLVVQLFNDGERSLQDLTRIETLGHVLSKAEEVLSGRYLNVAIRVPGALIERIAELPTVVNVEPRVAPELHDERQAQILAGNVDLKGPQRGDYLAWLSSRGFSSASTDYPIVAVVDDGLDDGTTVPLNPEFRALGDSAGATRIAFSVIPPGSRAPSPAGPAGHGTINASILAGYNADSGTAFADSFGFRYGLGVAPFTRIGNVRIFRPEFDTGNSTTSMVSDYYGRGARLSSNSWGSDVGGAYDAEAQLYDALARDAQPAVGGNQQLLFVFSAGNAGPSSNTLGSPATAKNVLTVGASEGSNPAATAGTGCGDVAGDGDDIRDMTSFSSRGPCDDGRIKPDLVAPGTFVLGAAARPEFDGSGVCGAHTNDFRPPGTDALFPSGSAYTWSSGTSHAAPAVAGMAALASARLRRDHGISSPSPALLKAFLIAGARHLSGANANENLPGANQGFGRADLGMTIRDQAPRLVHDQATLLSVPGASDTFAGRIINPAEPVRIVLAWTDAPGSTVGSAYVNDLNLQLEMNGTVYRGNNFQQGVSQPGGVVDYRNNVEAIMLPAGAQGTASITIEAVRLAGNGVPGNDDETDQDFALLAYNFAQISTATTVSFDADLYACNGTATVTVTDSDLTGAGVVSVTVSTTGGEAELVSAIETPPNSGVFRAPVPLTAGPVVKGDGVVQVDDQSTLTASASDAGTGMPMQAAAMIDCVAPTASSLTLGSIGGAQATLAITASEETTARIRFGRSCQDLSQSAESVALASSHTIVFDGLTPLTDYFYAVDVADRAGNSTTYDNHGECFAFTTSSQANYFTEQFESEFDLANTTLVFTPDGSVDFYRTCQGPAFGLPIDPAGGTAIPLEDDDFRQVNLSGGKTVAIYGQKYTSIYVGSNGYLTFGNGDNAVSEELAKHFALPRVSALFDDLDPDSGGGVSWKQLSDRAVITYLAVPEFGLGGSNTFQIELFFDGVIRITYTAMTVHDGLVGLSAGFGLPSGFVETDLTGQSVCPDSAGSLSLDRGLYSCQGNVTVRLHDGDLKSTGSATVELRTSGGDAEWLTVAELPPDSGSFSGSVEARFSPAQSGDGLLNLDGGQTIAAIYHDLDDGSGSPADIEARALVSCTDAFTLYGASRSTDTARTYKFEPVMLDDGYNAFGAQIATAQAIGIPARANGRAPLDAAIRYREYRTRLAAGVATPASIGDLHVLNECNDLRVELQKPTSLLLPARLDATAPVSAPLAEDHDRDHLLCYRARVQSKLSTGQAVPGMPKGMQIAMEDELDAGALRRYDLLHLSKVCVPTSKGGNPHYLNGPAKGLPKVITPATVRNPVDVLVCYKAALARKYIAQNGCVAANPADRGTAIDPPQSKHPAIDRLNVNDQFGPGQIDSSREREICLPSLVLAADSTAPGHR